MHKNAGEAIEAYHRRKKEVYSKILYPPFTYIFDTSREDLDEQIEEAVEKIRQIAEN